MASQAFRLLPPAVVLGFRANVDERQAQLVGHEGSLGYGTRGHAGHHLGLGETLGHEAAQFELDEAAQRGIGERFTVVAVERRFPPAGPREGRFGLQFDGLDGQQFLGKNFFQCLHNVRVLCKDSASREERKEKRIFSFLSRGAAYACAKRKCASREESKEKRIFLSFPEAQPMLARSESVHAEAQAVFSRSKSVEAEAQPFRLLQIKTSEG